MKIKTNGTVTVADLIALKQSAGCTWRDISDALGIKNATLLSWVYNKFKDKVGYETTLTPDQLNMATIRLLYGKDSPVRRQIKKAVLMATRGEESKDLTPNMLAFIVTVLDLVDYNVRD